MPPRPTGSTASFGRLFTTEVTGFLSGRLGEMIFKVADQSVIDKVISFLPDGVLDTPDKQKNFAFFASFLAGAVSRSPAAFTAVEKFMIESLEELSNRRGEYVGNDAKRKALLLEVFNKRVSMLDKLRTPTATAASEQNLPNAIAKLTKFKQREFYDWFNSLSYSARKHIEERWTNIIVAEERAMSIIDAPPPLRLELLNDLVENAPKTAQPKSRIDGAIEKITAVGSEWVDPQGRKMEEFAQKREEDAKELRAVVRRRSDIF